MTLGDQLPKLVDLSQRLSNAFVDPQPGVAQWCLAVADIIEQMYAIVGPDFATDPLPIMAGVLARRRETSLHIIEIKPSPEQVDVGTIFVGDNRSVARWTLLQWLRVALVSSAAKNDEEIAKLAAARQER